MRTHRFGHGSSMDPEHSEWTNSDSLAMVASKPPPLSQLAGPSRCTDCRSILPCVYRDVKGCHPHDASAGLGEHLRIWGKDFLCMLDIQILAMGRFNPRFTNQTYAAAAWSRQRWIHNAAVIDSGGRAGQPVSKRYLRKYGAVQPHVLPAVRLRPWRRWYRMQGESS